MSKRKTRIYGGGYEQELNAGLRSMRGAISAIRADGRTQEGRCRMMAGVCFLFGIQALNRKGLATAELVRALHDQEKRLLRLFGKPRPGSDCVEDAVDLLRDGYRNRNQTTDDVAREATHKLCATLQQTPKKWVAR